MKSKVKNLLTTISAFMTAATLMLSFACCKTDDEGAASGGKSGVVDVTRALGEQIDTSDRINSDLTDAAAAGVRSDGTRRIIVEMESDSMLDVYLGDSAVSNRYGNFTDYVNAAEGRQYSSALSSEQNKFIASLNRASIDYTVRHAYTSIINGVSLVVDDDDVAAIQKLDGVKSVIYSESYAVPEAEATLNEVNVYGTGIYDSSDIEYSGEGMVVAVLDTGFDRSHSAFQIMPEEQALTKSDIATKFNDFAASTHGDVVTVNDIYYNEKVPFAYDYADGDADVFPKSSSHGHHVAGIIAGRDDNVTAADGEAFAESGETFMGVAPDAQLVICKVFPDKEDGSEGGAETDDLLAALSDCITLGVDVINMSLGVSAGFSREEDGNAINDVYDKVYQAGINLVVAASNAGSSAQNGAYGSTNLTSNPDSGTVGSPATYAGSLSVASISGQLSSYMQLEDGTAIYFNESSTSAGEQGDFVEEILDGASEGTFRFVVVPGYGTSVNYTPAVIAELQKGNCIAVVSRGSNSFEEKQRIAAENGAIGCIIYNNMSGRISASLGTGKAIPTCTVTADIGQAFVSMGSGSIYLNETYKAGPFMSEFSSWGPTSDLKIKPEITAHGGEITSSVVGGYSIYSGTSMASPNMAGAVTLLREHVNREYGLEGVELSDRVNQLLMSTATIINDERGLPYAVRRQGAGLGDIAKAIASPVYLDVEGSTMPKLELGDDPSRRGVYSMQFHVKNMSNETRTYDLGAMVMTESVSIDGITVAEQAYMLDDAKTTYYVDGVKNTDGKVTVGADGDVVISVTIELTGADKDYLDANFENGMYVEGFITLDAADGQGVDLSIPYLAYYGDWLDAPIFDKTTYEVSADYYNTAIEDEDKTIAALYETVVIGRYYKGTETYIPLGQYVYDVEGGADSGIESMVDKVAVGNSDYGVYEFYAVYFGMLRSVESMDIHIENSVTGEVIYENTVDKVAKSYQTSPSYAEVAIQPYEMGLQNNTQYTATFTTRAEYNGRKGKEEVQTFTFYVDYEAPIVEDTENVVRFEYDVDDKTLRHAYLDLYLYDNHYVQSVQLFTYAEAENNVDWATEDIGTVDWLTEYAIPVDSSRGVVNKVTVEITDYLDNLISVEGETEKYIGVRVDDYALNSAAYVVPIQMPEVSGIDISYTYMDSLGQSVTSSLDGATIVMNAGTGLDLTDEDETGTVMLANGELVNGAEFKVDLYNYGIYECTGTLSHGAACAFAYDEHTGLTYSEGDYYYDDATGTVKRKTANETSPAYAPGTRFNDVIARREGSGYVTNHFVCPGCGAEVTFTYNSRTDKLTADNFTKVTPDAMYEEVIWESSDESIVRIWNGRLYAASAGTVTITAYAPDAARYPYPMDGDPYKLFSFKVTVEGDSVTPTVESLSVGSYDNLTLNNSRLVSSGYVSVENGTKLVLYPQFKPWYVESVPNLTWRSSDPEIVEVLSSDTTQATVLCKSPGSATIMLQAGRYMGTFTINVGEDFVLMNTYFYEYNGPGYTEVYTDPETQEQSNILVIPANLGITNLGYVLATREGPFFENKNIDTVIVPEGVTAIGLSCFENSTIRRIYLPSTLITLSYGAFADCENLEGVYWYDASEDSDSGIEYDADKNTYNWDKFFATASTEMTAQSLVVGSDAFYGCAKLRDIDFGGVTALYEFAFDGCTSLSGTLDLTDLRFSGMNVFNGCVNVTGVELDVNTVLGAYMFTGTSIQQITYYGSYVGDRVFSGMPDLRSVTFAVPQSQNYSSLTTIGSRAFENCTSLESVTFERSFTTLGSYAFAGCSSLAEIELPAGLTSLGDYAFQGCSSLESVVIDGSSQLEYIGADLFRGCTSLASISLESDSAYYQQITAGDCCMIADKSGNAVLVPPAFAVQSEGDTVVVGEGMTAIGDNAYANNASFNGKTIIIADSVKSIGRAAFAGTGAVKVIIPATVEEIGADAFAYSEQLTGAVLYGDLTAIPEGMFRGCTSLTSVQIPDSVSVIGAHAFEGAALGSLDIGRSVTSIGDYAFADNASLVALNFASNSRLTQIGSHAFDGCAALSEVVLPDSLASLGSYAFYGNDSLVSVYVSASLNQMGSHAFAGCAALETVVIGDGATVIGDYAFANVGSGSDVSNNSLTSVTVPASVASIGDYAFAGSVLLTSIDLPGVEEIGSHAFADTTLLAEVKLSDAASYIGESAFEGSGVKDIDLSGVEYFDARAFYGTAITNGDFTDAIEIGNSAFYNCTSITSLNLPNAEQIYGSAFYVPSDQEGGQSRGSIQTITLGDKLKGLGGGAFFGSLIRTIALPASLEIIGTPAFAGCSNLQFITVDGGNKVFFVDDTTGGLYKHLANGTYELVAVPNAINLSGIGENTQPFVILEGTSRVGAWAMGYCVNIHAVEIPASVKTIGAYAFYYMGMRLVTDGSVTGGDFNSELYPLYIFNGLQAPVLETEYSTEEAASFIAMYFNFSRQVGYLVNNMIIPVNAAGFDSALFKYFFRDIQYSEELIEPDTMQFLEWIQGVDVQSLTLADEETVTTMSRIYNMLGDGQKAFLSEYEDKFAQVLAKMNELTGNTGDDDEVPDTDGDEDDQTPPESGDNTSLIVIVCCSAGAVVLIAAAVVAVLVVRRKKASAKAQTSAEGGAHTQTDNSDREDGENE